VAAVLVMGMLSCAPGGNGSPSLPTAPPAAATIDSLVPYFGSYRTGDGDIVVIARMGWYFDMGDSAYRTIYATRSPNHFTIGRFFMQPLPMFADLLFAAGTLTITDSAHKRVGRRIAYKQTDVTISAYGAQLAGTITEPGGGGPHPGIVIVHGAETGERYFYDVWVGVYASMGLDVLTYDKRGRGSSTGRYPGEFPSVDALAIYADDAGAALGFLARWAGVDPKQVGLHGGSQGGWTVPLAIQQRAPAAFAVLVSAPATTVDQTDLWASFTHGGESMPAVPLGEMLASVRANHSGYDPAPALQALAIPTLWLLGSNDRTVPTAVCVEILTALHKPNFTIDLLPAGHGMLVNPTGLAVDDSRSPGLAPGLLPALSVFILRSTGASRPSTG
jgi:dienelactone hydrolase